LCRDSDKIILDKKILRLTNNVVSVAFGIIGTMAAAVDIATDTAIVLVDNNLGYAVPMLHIL
jgi:hypothetical protein